MCYRNTKCAHSATKHSEAASDRCNKFNRKLCAYWKMSLVFFLFTENWKAQQGQPYREHYRVNMKQKRKKQPQILPWIVLRRVKGRWMRQVDCVFSARPSAKPRCPPRSARSPRAAHNFASAESPLSCSSAWSHRQLPWKHSALHGWLTPCGDLIGWMQLREALKQEEDSRRLSRSSTSLFLLQMSITTSIERPVGNKLETIFEKFETSSNRHKPNCVEHKPPLSHWNSDDTLIRCPGNEN